LTREENGRYTRITLWQRSGIPDEMRGSPPALVLWIVLKEALYFPSRSGAEILGAAIRNEDWQKPKSPSGLRILRG